MTHYESFYEFVKAAWNHVDPSPYVDNWHIKVVCDHLQAVTYGKIRNLVINLPPGMGMSTIASAIWPIWDWNIHSNQMSINISHDIELCLRDGLKSWLLSDSEFAGETLSDSWSMNGWVRNSRQMSNNQGGRRYFSTMDGSSKSGSRYSRIIFDSPTDPRKRIDKKHFVSMYTKYQEVFATRFDDIDRQQTVLIESRMARDDLTDWIFTHRIAAGLTDYHRLKITAQYHPSHSPISTYDPKCVDPRTEDGESIFPTRFPREALDYIRTKKMGECAYRANFQQDPID